MYLLPVFTISPSENKAWTPLSWRLRAAEAWYCLSAVRLVLLRCLCTLTPCQSAAVPRRRPVRRSAPLCTGLCCHAGSSLGAKWFLSLGKQSPSNLGPLRSIWIHFTLTRRKTGNLRARLQARAEPAGNRAAVCQRVCTVASQRVCVGLVRSHGYLYEQRGTVYSTTHATVSKVETQKDAKHRVVHDQSCQKRQSCFSLYLCLFRGSGRAEPDLFRRCPVSHSHIDTWKLRGAAAAFCCQPHVSSHMHNTSSSKATRAVEGGLGVTECSSRAQLGLPAGGFRAVIGGRTRCWSNTHLPQTHSFHEAVLPQCTTSRYSVSFVFNKRWPDVSGRAAVILTQRSALEPDLTADELKLGNMSRVHTEWSRELCVFQK